MLLLFHDLNKQNYNRCLILILILRFILTTNTGMVYRFKEFNVVLGLNKEKNSIVYKNTNIFNDMIAQNMSSVLVLFTKHYNNKFLTV